MRIDHIGIVVKDIESGIAFWENAFGYKQITNVVTNSRQKVKVVFLQKEDSIDVKLIEPTGNDSTVYRFSARGGGLHHICFNCAGLENQISELQEKGIRLIVPPQPGEAFDNNLIAFMMGKYGINFELIDTNDRAQMRI